MHRLSWGRHGPKATSIDGEVKDRFGQPAAPKVEEPRKPNKSIVQHETPPPQIQIPPSQGSGEMHLQSRAFAGIDFQTDKWIDSLPPPQYIEIPAPTVTGGQGSNRDVPDLAPQSQIPFPDADLPQSTPFDRTLSSGYSTELQSFLSSASSQSTKTGRRRKASTSSTSTLFERSPTVPITIVVTTPEDDTPPWLSTPSYGGNFPPVSPLRRVRNGSTMSLPSVATTRPLPDRSRLMPPINSQVDARKLRKAQELKEIRHFLVGFLNVKGDQLPQKLRIKIMSTYGITAGDLDPRTVARFDLGSGDIKDEGVVLEHGLFSGEPGNRDHLRILEMAFQSVIPVVTPTPHPAHEILKQKRMSTYSQSLASVDSTVEKSPISKRMSLSTNAKSKTTLDSIINSQSAAKIRRQSMPFPLKRSATVSSLPSKPSPKSLPIIVLPQHKLMPSSKPELIQRRASQSSTTSAPPKLKFYTKPRPFSTIQHSVAPPMTTSKHFPLNHTQAYKPVTASATSQGSYAHYGGANSKPALKTALQSRLLVRDLPDELQHNVPTKSRLRSSRPASMILNSASESRPLNSVPSKSYQDPFPRNSKAQTIPQVYQAKSDSPSRSRRSIDSYDETLLLVETTSKATVYTPKHLSLSTSSSFRQPRTQTYHSNPNIRHNTVENMFPRHPAVTPLRENDSNWLKVDEKQSQIVREEQKEKSKRSSIFEILRSAFGGSRKVKDAKISESRLRF